ncbi:MAG TPA: AraC family transcriptional regulator [Thermoanaerobaculia bacterium]
MQQEVRNDGFDVQQLHRSDTVAVSRWQCRGGTGPIELRHAWYVLSFTHSGTFLLHAGPRTETIDATRTVVLRPGEPYRLSRSHGRAASGSAVALHPAVFERLFARGADSLTRAGADGQPFLLQHLLLLLLVAQPPEEGSAVDEAVLWIFAQALAAPPSDMLRVAGGKRRDTIAGVQALLATHGTRALQLEEIARAVKRSPFHLSRAFKQETGMPMHLYLNRLRIRRALEGVVGRNESVSELAYAAGYSSHSHFTEAFRQEFGIAPTEARRLARLRRVAELRDALAVA